MSGIEVKLIGLQLAFSLLRNLPFSNPATPLLFSMTMAHQSYLPILSVTKDVVNSTLVPSNPSSQSGTLFLSPYLSWEELAINHFSPILSGPKIILLLKENRKKIRTEWLWFG